MCVCVADESARRTRYWKEEDQSGSRDQLLTVHRGLKQFLSLFFFFFCAGASAAHLHSQKILASKKKKSQVFSFMIELCWRKQTAEWGVQQLWLNLFLLSVRRPQVNIGFALCAFFSTGSWAFSPSGSPGLQERRYRFLKKKIKVKKCIISSSWKPSCFLYPLVWRSVLDCCLL